MSEQQPTRRRVREERRFDKTQLHESHHGQYCHRDYAAHFFRWGWVSRQIKQGESVLDIGCGQDQPLAKVLSGRPGGNRETYVGVDLNRITSKFNAAWCTVLDEFNFIEDWEQLLKLEVMDGEGFEHIVCLEVIEHMGVEDGDGLLTTIQNVISEGGRLYLSTPVFSGYAAANHLHEYGVEELHQKLDRAGFNVLHRYGTFGQLPKLRRVYDEFERELEDRLSGWYGNDVLSVIMALKHPDEASNNLWVCEPK